MAKKVDFKKVKEEIKALIAEVGEISQESITDEARLSEDLGVDSMMALEIVAKLEKKYKIVIPEEKIPVIRSLSDICKLLEGILAKK